MSSELRKYGSTAVVQTPSVGFTSEVSDYLAVHNGPGTLTVGVLCTDRAPHLSCTAALVMTGAAVHDQEP